MTDLFAAAGQNFSRREQCDAFRQAALNAWERYRKTGLHDTADEVDTWLASWGTEAELPAPKAHK